MQATRSISVSKRDPSTKERKEYLFFSMIVLVLVIDLSVPYLRWKEIIPAEIRWLSHAMIAFMIVMSVLRMIVYDRFPVTFWLIMAVSMIGGIVAITNGQGYLATAWGWWNMFQYPFVGMFAYLQPSWPDKFPGKVQRLLLGILVTEVIIQLIQFALGETPGDNLAGLFGEHGTAKLVIFILLILAVALGAWLAKGRWQSLAIVFGLGGISSVLGEVKMFPFAAFGMGLIALVLLILRGRRVWRLVPYLLLIFGILVIFFVAYNAVVPAAERRPLEQFLTTEKLDSYLGNVSEQKVGDQYYYSVGRNFAVQYAWSSLKKNASTFFLGFGLGARGESETLGTSGSRILRGKLGGTSGTSLLVIMQELAIIGFITLGGFFLWVVYRLFSGIRDQPDTELSILRYGLLIFTIMWPIWLWYSSVWNFRVAMLVYWVILGYVLSHTDGKGHPVTSRDI